jgi:hypothetical protein
MYRQSRFLLTLTASLLAWLSLMFAGALRAQDSTPLSGGWNIASSGTAGTSGELLFRLTPADGGDATEVTVFVLSGTNETGVASSIRRALSTQLNAARYDVEAGEGANVLVTPDRPDDRFALQLVDSDVENVRVVVQSTTPVAPPTVPPQNVPADPPTVPTPATPGAPGTNSAPPGPAQPAEPPAQSSSPPALPSSPPAESSAPPAQPSAPPAKPSSPPTTPSTPPDSASDASGGAGAPASAPPPPPGT